MSEKGGKYLKPEMYAELVKILEKTGNKDALNIVQRSRSGAWKHIDAKPAEFLSGNTNGNIRIVIRTAKKTMCLERPVKDFDGKKRAYVYQDLADVL